MSPSYSYWLTLVWFALTYLGLALGKIPGLRMDRAGIALVGATLVLVTGLISFDQAVSPKAIDYKTLALLFGMMVVVGYLRLSGVFQHLSAAALRRIKSPTSLLAAIVTLSGVLSAFLINDIVCIALTPLVLHLARRLRCDPLPHLIALATAANIGSAGAITGNPQNIYIGSHSGIGYVRFAERLMPVAALGLFLDFMVIAWVYRGTLRVVSEDSQPPEPNQKVRNPARVSRFGDGVRTTSRPHWWLRRKSVAVALVTVALFFTGLPLELIALGAAAFLLVSRVKPEKIYQQIDWSLLVLFTALFMVVFAFRIQVVEHWNIKTWSWLQDDPVAVLSIVSAALSNLVSNVPAVLLMEPIMHAIAPHHQETAWLALAMSSTFAGNLTVLGSVANLIVVESARRHGVAVSFWEYCKVGVPITLLTLTLGIAWLGLVQY